MLPWCQGDAGAGCTLGRGVRLAVLGGPRAGSLLPGAEHTAVDPCPGQAVSQPAPERAHPARTSARRMDSPARGVVGPHPGSCSDFGPTCWKRCPGGRSTTLDLDSDWSSSRMGIVGGSVPRACAAPATAIAESRAGPTYKRKMLYSVLSAAHLAPGQQSTKNKRSVSSTHSTSS